MTHIPVAHPPQPPPSSRPTRERIVRVLRSIAHKSYSVSPHKEQSYSAKWGVSNGGTGTVCFDTELQESRGYGYTAPSCPSERYGIMRFVMLRAALRRDAVTQRFGAMKSCAQRNAKHDLQEMGM